MGAIFIAAAIQAQNKVRLIRILTAPVVSCCRMVHMMVIGMNACFAQTMFGQLRAPLIFLLWRVLRPAQGVNEIGNQPADRVNPNQS